MDKHDLPSIGRFVVAARVSAHKYEKSSLADAHVAVIYDAEESGAWTYVWRPTGSGTWSNTIDLTTATAGRDALFAAFSLDESVMKDFPVEVLKTLPPSKLMEMSRTSNPNVGMVSCLVRSTHACFVHVRSAAQSPRGSSLCEVVELDRYRKTA